MKLRPYFIDCAGNIIGVVPELPDVNSVEEAKSLIISLPRHLSGRHIEYIEQPPEVKQETNGAMRDGVRPCEGLDD